MAMALRIDDELDRAITELAEKAGVSKQEAVRRAVLETGDRARYRGWVDAACGRARSSVFGQDAYPSVPLEAAALLHSICPNHALVDGNERLALVTAATFLRANDAPYTLTDDESFELIPRSPRVASTYRRQQPG